MQVCVLHSRRRINRADFRCISRDVARDMCNFDRLLIAIDTTIMHRVRPILSPLSLSRRETRWPIFRAI